MQKTGNYNLNKPDYNDGIDIEKLNENADIIDKILFETDKNINVYCGLATGDGNSYLAKAEKTLTEYKDGMFVTIVPNAICTNNPTLNIDNVGAVILKNSSGRNLIRGEMKPNIPYTFIKSGSSFFLRSSKSNSILTKNPWAYFGSDIPSGRRDSSAFCIWEGKIYCVGGAYASASVEIYDIENDTWTNGADMPVVEIDLTAQVYNGKMYCIGGTGFDGRVQIYDIINNKWSNGESMPVPAYSMISEIYNGKIYCIGGRASGGGISNTGYINSVQIYDIEKDIWTIGAAMPTSRSDSASVLQNGKIYCIGGSTICVPYHLSTVEIYDITNNIWSAGINMPTPRLCLTAQVYNGKIYCIGGYNEVIHDLCKVEVYDTVLNQWSASINMPTKRYQLGSVLYNGKIYCLGGTNEDSEFINKVEVYVADWSLE